jgi:hypothetical protein
MVQARVPARTQRNNRLQQLTMNQEHMSSQMPSADNTSASPAPSLSYPPAPVYSYCLSPEPTLMPCPVCQQIVSTKTEKEIGGCSLLTTVLMYMSCLWCCSCFGLCCDSCKDTKHHCTKCNYYLGKHRRL